MILTNISVPEGRRVHLRSGPEQARAAVLQRQAALVQRLRGVGLQGVYTISKQYLNTTTTSVTILTLHK